MPWARQMTEPAAPSETLWQTVKADFSRASGRQLVAVVAVLLWMAFQWGWGNDILLPPIVARAFDAVDNGTSWLSGFSAVLAATGAGSLFWGVTQALDAVIVLSGIRLLPGITGRISARLKRHGWVKPVSELSLGTKFLIAYATGASALCLVDVFATGKPGLRSRGTMVMQAVALAVAGVGLVIFFVTGVTVIGSRIPALEETAETVVRYAKNPLTWIVIYGAIIGGSALVSRLRSSSADIE